MDTTEQDNERFYSLLGLIVLITSLMIGVFFYFRQRNLPENVETMVLPQTQTVPTQAIETEALPTIIRARTAVMKIAVPHEVTAVLTDSQGRQTGILEGKTLNAIPLSEFSPDKLAGTVSWILVGEPSEETYQLAVTGTSEKALAVYVVNEEEREDLELIQLPNSTQHTYTIRFDPVSADSMITITQL